MGDRVTMLHEQQAQFLAVLQTVHHNVAKILGMIEEDPGAEDYNEAPNGAEPTPVPEPERPKRQRKPRVKPEPEAQQPLDFPV